MDDRDEEAAGKGRDAEGNVLVVAESTTLDALLRFNYTRCSAP